MRSQTARWLVRWRARYIEAAYLAYCHRAPRREAFYNRIGQRVERVAFPLARRLDRGAMTDQMIEECWWG